MHRSIIVLSVGLWLAPGCGTDGGVETVYDPCSRLTIVVSPDITLAETLAVEDAILGWARVLPTKIEVGIGTQASDALPLHFESGDTYYRAIYWDSEGTISISRDALAPEDYALAVAHELGHAFGLLHVPNDERWSVMNVGNLDAAPTEEDAAEVRALWATCTMEPGSDSRIP